MISCIRVNNVATYSDIAVEPKQINFVYGGNGTGKTTLSKVISGTSNGKFHIEWKDDVELETLVFNGEFIERNFGERINGIFTLGENNGTELKNIEQLAEEIDKLGDEISIKIRSAKTQEQKLQETFHQFAETCWSQKKTFSRFTEILKGSMGSKETFAKTCLSKAQAVSVDGRPKIEQLLDEYENLYGKTLQKQKRLDLLGLTDIAVPEPCHLLKEPITGSADTPIGTFIDYLQNSNWVRQGIDLFPLTEGRCPYCQRALPVELEAEIESYFDENYSKNVAAIQGYRDAYASFLEKTTQVVDSIKKSVPAEYDIDEAINAGETLRLVLASNLSAINRKLADPSSVIELNNVASALTGVKDAFEQIDKEIAANNELYDNVSSAKLNLSCRVWGLILYNLDSTLKDYEKTAEGLEKAIRSIQSIIADKEAERTSKEKKKAVLETTRTSIVPTINAINSLLERFGFTGFRLSEDTQNKGMYKIVRPDGTDAKKTLSEGEHNFISFLYFYYRVYGSLNTKGIDTPRVVVIDDPISSLDSNVMFIVTSLSKEIAKDCKDGKHGIRQVFILTHNVYFHKEVTFLGSRAKWPETKTAYWVINKANDRTAISLYADNPISTSYELLWDEIRNADDAPNKNVFNTMRRILEYYFSVIGGIDYEKCINQFEGADKITCKALVSCINEGSHLISDDFFIVFSPEAMESYRRVFKEIFYKLEQRAHYDMMMEKNAALPPQI